MTLLPVIFALICANPPAEQGVESEETEATNTEAVFYPPLTKRAEPNRSDPSECKAAAGLFLVTLRKGVRNAEVYLRYTETSLAECGLTLQDVEVGDKEIAFFKQRSCVLNARLTYRYDLEQGLGGETANLRRLERNLRECKAAEDEIKEILWKSAKSTRFRPYIRPSDQFTNN